MWRDGVVLGGRTRFHVRALGDGADLAVLLHGWPEDGTAWRMVAPRLADAGWRVACPDLKGYGRSDAPRSGYDPETLADEVAQLIRNLHARRALLVGHDWGGAVALATAFRHPGRVRALVTVSAPYRELDLVQGWLVPLLNLPFTPELVFRVAARPVVRAALRYASVDPSPFTDVVVDRYAAAVSAAPHAWLRYYRSLSRRAVLERASRLVRGRVPAWGVPEPPRLRVPALVVWGERDRVTPLRLGVGVARDLGAHLVQIAGVGHFVPEEAPAALADAILGHVATSAVRVRGA